jgi:hypothetical protein
VNRDIGDILKSWDYNPNSIIVRKIIGDDSKEKLQIRVNLGILQMEVDGRPDGKTPNGEESLLDYYGSLINKLEMLEGSASNFTLTEQDMNELDIEVMQYYHRRICFFALNDYVHARMDAEHNLHLMDLIKNYCKDRDYVDSHEQYRPFVIMERTRAAGLESLNNHDYAKAMEYISDAMIMIQDFYNEHGVDEEDIGRRHELTLLRKWREKIHQDWEGGVTDIDENDFGIQ